MYKFGVIGLGHMGGAIIKGSIACGALNKYDLLLFDLNSNLTAEFQEDGYTLAASLKELRINTEFLLLAVPPQAFDSLLIELSSYKPIQKQTVVSIAAGIDFSFIKSRLGNETDVICVMPNTPLLIGIGATAIAVSEGVSEDSYTVVKNIFSAMGVVEKVTEEQLFAVVPANGSTPAYVYYFIDSIAKAVAARGVDYDTALRLTSQSFKGSAELLMQSDKTAQQLIDGICTPGGLTAQTIAHFDKIDLTSIIKEGCDACIDKGLEIRGQRR